MWQRRKPGTAGGVVGGKPQKMTVAAATSLHMQRRFAPRCILVKTMVSTMISKHDRHVTKVDFK